MDIAAFKRELFAITYDLQKICLLYTSLGDLAQALDAFAHLLLRRDAHDAVVGEVHAALRGVRILLRFREPLIDGRFPVSYTHL